MLHLAKFQMKPFMMGDQVDEFDKKLIVAITRLRIALGTFVIELNSDKKDIMDIVNVELNMMYDKLGKDKEIPEGYEGHVHGCGHPTRVLLMNDDPYSIIQSGYWEWHEEHEKAKESECICFFCWEKMNKLKEGKCPYEKIPENDCIHMDDDGNCHGICARIQEENGVKVNPDDNMLCKDNDGCSGGVMHKQPDGTYLCDVCLKRIY